MALTEIAGERFNVYEIQKRLAMVRNESQYPELRNIADLADRLIRALLVERVAQGK